MESVFVHAGLTVHIMQASSTIAASERPAESFDPLVAQENTDAAGITDEGPHTYSHTAPKPVPQKKKRTGV